jgi:hypothetical protein
MALHPDAFQFPRSRQEEPYKRSEFPPLPDFGADGVGTPRSGAADPVN